DQLLVTHGIYSCFLAITEYHQQAVDLFSPFNHEWCTYYLNSGLPATSFLMIFLCTTYLSFAPILLKSRTKIIMENSKDGFITRNRDSIIVGVIFYLLGVGTTPILSLWQ
ncbi:hypothetical protein NH514_21055, partial [Pseudoalteromonas sp. ACER1]|uniref:hypothetical protein n=1 Tax=unclassified Pseudoalteromonas TaxID=194690 RepID=UPI001F33D4F8